MVPNTNPYVDTGIDTTVAMHNNQDFTQKYRVENNETSNPFVMGIKIWQNYVRIWMKFYTEILNNYVRNASRFLKTNRDNNNNQ